MDFFSPLTADILPRAANSCKLLQIWKLLVAACRPTKRRGREVIPVRNDSNAEYFNWFSSTVRRGRSWHSKIPWTRKEKVLSRPRRLPEWCSRTAGYPLWCRYTQKPLAWKKSKLRSRRFTLVNKDSLLHSCGCLDESVQFESVTPFSIHCVLKGNSLWSSFLTWR